MWNTSNIRRTNYVVYTLLYCIKLRFSDDSYSKKEPFWKVLHRSKLYIGSTTNILEASGSSSKTEYLQPYSASTRRISLSVLLLRRQDASCLCSLPDLKRHCSLSNPEKSMEPTVPENCVQQHEHPRRAL